MQQIERAGEFFLKSRGKRGTFQICWYDAKRRQTVSTSTGTSDHEKAKRKLLEHALRHSEAPKGQDDAQLADVMNRYYINRGSKLASAETARYAMRAALNVWNDPNVNSLNATKQMEFVTALRTRGVTDHTIARWLGVIFAAINYARECGMLRAVPKRIGNKTWNPHLPNREGILTVEQLGRLFDAARSQQHWWRYMVAAVATGARPAALLELTRKQMNFHSGIVDLLPEGRAQNNKRRPKLRMVPTFMHWALQCGPGYFITYEDKPLKTREFFDSLAEMAGVTATPYMIRHTVATWLAEHDVPHAERDIWMGHRGEGSATGARYVHLQPTYLKRAAAAIELLFQAIDPHVEGGVTGKQLDDQPLPGEASVASAWQALRA